MCQSSVGDIISNLPIDAIDNIIARLPLREAGRTCILSQRWRYMWANLPYLRVYDTTFTTEMKEKTQDKLLIAIFEVLLLKRVPIVKLDLYLRELESSRHLDLLVSFVSRNRGLQELTLVILKFDEKYKLPPSLFSCLELTHLTLWNCVIEPPTQFKGFNRLISLELINCSILPGVVSDIISSSPLLEELNVTGYTLLNGLTQISAPNLRVLNFKGSISFKYVPCLSSCVLVFSYGSTLAGETSNALQSFCNLVAVEDLKIRCTFGGLLQYKSVVRNTSLPRKLTTSLNHLKSLNLTGIGFHVLYEVSLVLCLIRSSPNLTKIVVDTVQYACETDAADLEQITHLLEVQEWSETCLNSLREAEVHGVTNKAPDLGFVQLLLAISPKLETMIVSPHSSMSLEERLEISAKMLRFRGPTPLAEIIYKY